ncbi:MAG: TonB-dependent receptor [Fidelibacterota bacterium]|nr:MAG: TonB-dependent receptor [Candidatus Neomarinimicrobiota bacterium]
MKRILQTAVILLVPIYLFSQETGKIAGKVTDEATGDPLTGANVLVEGTTFGAATNVDGRYVILGVPVGTFTVRCEFIGYRPVRLSSVEVHKRLTTEADFGMSSEALELGVVDVVAERPLIVQDATNTTRIIDAEVINKIPLRGVGNLIALQTGAVTAGANIYVRGARQGDISYYVDGVYTVNPWNLANTTVVSNRAMEEIAFQSGGFDAEFGNSNGGMVSTTTRTGGEQWEVSAEYVQDLGASKPGTDKDALYSYGYQLYNVNLGGSFGNRMRFFGSYEHLHSEDNNPSISSFPSVDRRASNPLKTTYEQVIHNGDTSIVQVLGYSYESLEENDPDFLEFVYNVKDDTVWGYLGEDGLDNDNDGLTDEDDETWNDGIANVERLTRIVYGENGPDTTYYLTAYDNYKKLYGRKFDTGYDRDAFAANLLIDLKPLRIKVGGHYTATSSRPWTSTQFTGFPNSFAMANTENHPLYETTSLSGYANLTFSLTESSFIRANLSYYDYQREEMDNRHRDNFLAYGDPLAEGNEWLRSYGKNPIAMARFVNFDSYGTVYDDYRKRHSSYMGLKGDYVNQLGNHEIKAGLSYRAHTLRDYILLQPMEVFEETEKARLNNAGVDLIEGTADDLASDNPNYIDITTDEWFFQTYRNAYTLNTGYTLDGKENDKYNYARSAMPPGKPVILGFYLQDKIELEDMILNVGIRYDYFDFATDVPETYDYLYLKDGHIDRETSGFSVTKPYTYLSPRVGFSFPVTDQTVLHAQYGEFVQHPILNRLYLSDSRLAANLTQGNMVVSPNGKLKPERTTQYEIGFAQQVSDFAALDITGYYKEVRDYTLMKNRDNAFVDNAKFNWAQYENGDYGLVKGVSASLTVRRIRGLMARASYTLQWANGTGSDPITNWNIAWTGDQYPTAVNPLDYDQRHTGSVMVDYRTGQLFGLFELGTNALWRFGSGLAYTPSLQQSEVFGRGWYAPVAGINSGYGPWTSSMDLRLDLDTIAGSGVSLYVLVLNAFNSENVIDVYPTTGEAGTDGWLETPAGQVWLLGRPESASYYDDRLRDPGRWDNPRIVRIGLTYGL